MPPVNFLLGNPAAYFDITTTATFVGGALICITYPAGSIPTDTTPRMYHFINNAWEDVTVSVDTATRTVCGRVASFSPIVIGFLPLTPGVLRLTPRLWARDGGSGAGKDAWGFSAGIAGLDTAAGNAILALVDADGVALELRDGASVLDTVVYSGDTDCRRQKPQQQSPVVCTNKSANGVRLRTTFAFTRKGQLTVKSTLKRRTLATAGSLTSVAAPELRIYTTSALGTLTVQATQCKASARKLECRGSA